MNLINGRESTGWLQLNISPRQRIPLITTTTVHEEVFSSLEYVSEISSVGEQFLRNRGATHPKRTFKLLKAFVRQGKAFYLAGRQLHFRASALMYYYSFLNLAKAYISISDPDFVINRPSHGLALGRFTSSSLSKQGIYITDQQDGVFQKLYEIEKELPPPRNYRLNIVRLLGYCSDIRHEYDTLGLGKGRTLRVKSRVFTNDVSKISWPVLAVHDFAHLKPYNKTLAPFFGYFHQILPEQIIAREIFGFLAEVYRRFSYFESKKTYLLSKESKVYRDQMSKDVYSVCKPLFDSPIYDDEYDFNLVIPLRRNHQIPFSQPLAIYSLMFYMGSLVRYRPDYLENLLNSKDAWIIERFVMSSPITFLRYISNAILQKDYLYSTR